MKGWGVGIGAALPITDNGSRSARLSRMAGLNEEQRKAWDAVYGQGGVDLGFTGSTAAGIPANWYSRAGDYGQPATYFTSLADKDKAVAPDRNDFGKWQDVAELF